MGFFRINEVISAYGEGKIEEFLAEYDANDLALLKSELDGYSNKHNRREDLKGLLVTVDNILQEKQKNL